MVIVFKYCVYTDFIHQPMFKFTPQLQIAILVLSCTFDECFDEQDFSKNLRVFGY